MKLTDPQFIFTKLNADEAARLLRAGNQKRAHAKTQRYRKDFSLRSLASWRLCVSAFCFFCTDFTCNTTIVIIKEHVIHHEGHEGHEGHEVHKTSNGIDGASFFKYCLRELRGKKLMKARFIGFYNSLVVRD
jgi:hypothetical protein